MEIFKLVIPLILNTIVFLLLIIPNHLKRKIILITLFSQIIINIIAMVLAIVNLSSEAISNLNLGLSISSLILSIILFFIIVWRRWEFARRTIYG